ncbi:MAG: copper amine oxidase N-terminal domain-containing protein, partial [Erysipelotrichia bacterium]|nr:copper amine oxidase N-terminal domain-containing protein [Erysipelotrichia bacterium]
MKEKIISLLSALALTAQIVPCALADSDVKVYVNNTEIVTDAPIIIENDRTLVPVRAISEYLDYSVDWDGDTQTVVISKNLTTLKFTIGNL